MDHSGTLKAHSEGAQGSQNSLKPKEVAKNPIHPLSSIELDIFHINLYVHKEPHLDRDNPRTQL